MKSLAQIYERYQAPECFGDKGTIHSYIEIYEELLAPYRSTAKRVLEIGLLTGISLRMWEEYFFQSEVYGIDIDLKPVNGMGNLEPMIAEGTHHIELLDATDPAQVQAHFVGLLFDVIIEDASHAFTDQLAIYANFKPHLAPGALYVIEDIADIDLTRATFSNLDPKRPTRIIDRRAIKGRFDDVLVTFGGR